MSSEVKWQCVCACVCVYACVRVCGVCVHVCVACVCVVSVVCMMWCGVCCVLCVCVCVCVGGVLCVMSAEYLNIGFFLNFHHVFRSFDGHANDRTCAASKWSGH